MKIVKKAGLCSTAFFIEACQPRYESSFFDADKGGDPVYFQHLFWLIGHPEVYIPIIGTIALLFFVLWQRIRKGSTKSSIIKLPRISLLSALWLIGSLLIILAGMALAFFNFRIGVDTALHDTYYVVAHYPVVLSFLAISIFFAFFYIFFERVFKQPYNRILAWGQSLTFYLGVALLILPQLFLGMRGMPRRYAEYDANLMGLNSLTQLGVLLCFISIAAFALVIAEALVRSVKMRDRGDP